MTRRIRRPSIRARISLLLLLSTLNSVALAAGALALFSALADSPTQSLLDAARFARQRVAAIEARTLNAALKDEPLDRDVVREALTNARAEVAETEVWDANLQADWDAWAAEVQVVSAATGRGMPVGPDAIGRLRLTHDRLVGRMLLAGDYTRPEWVDRSTPILPWFAVWIAAVSIATVVMAYSLDVLLSRPLAGLADAADKVGGGDLSQEIEARRSVPEVERVARAIAGMRDRLVRTIADVESRAQEMETILTHLSDGVLLIDPKGVILELNRAAQRLLAPPERSRIVEGRLLTAGEAPPAEGAQITRWLPELAEAERGKEAQLEIVREYSGGKRWFEVAVSRVPLGRVVVVRDVTQDRELEKLKRDFLSVITHELKTPLTPIEGYARLLQLGKGGPLTEKQAQFVAIIHTQAGILKTMVQNLLDATRIEGGQLPIHPQPVELAGFVDQVGNTWRGNTETRGIHFELDNRLPVGTSITADPFRLEQALGNLLSNAGKFTAAGGTVRLAAELKEGTARVSVADTGRGIPAEALPRVFERFYQVERGDTRAAGGAGLGLYIVRQLVNAMGGSVSVDSEPGVGSRFELAFPILPGGTP